MATVSLFSMTKTALAFADKIGPDQKSIVNTFLTDPTEFSMTFV